MRDLVVVLEGGEQERLLGAEMMDQAGFADARLGGDSTIPLWQVPRNAYGQCLVSMDQLALHVQPKVRIGQYLHDAIVNLEVPMKNFLNLGETYTIGDSPLVLLTALQSSFQPNTSSSSYVTMPAPQINSDGSYTLRTSGRNIRVYTELDVRLMFDDFFSKLELYFG